MFIYFFFSSPMSLVTYGWKIKASFKQLKGLIFFRGKIRLKFPPTHMEDVSSQAHQVFKIFGRQISVSSWFSVVEGDQSSDGCKRGIAIESWLSWQTGTSMLYLKVQLQLKIVAEEWFCAHTTWAHKSGHVAPCNEVISVHTDIYSLYMQVIPPHYGSGI